jgi:hypothetical protein
MNEGKKMKKTILCVLLCMGLAEAAQALTTLNFDAYADYQNLNGVDLGDVTLTSTTGIVEVLANNRFGASYNSSPNSIWMNSWVTTDVLTGTFESPVTYVSLWAGDEGGDNDQWELHAYDALIGGNLVGSVTSPVWNGAPYWQLAIPGAGIMRFEAQWLGPAAPVAFDDLSFETGNAVPAPAAWLLGTLGAGLVGWIRRRQVL